jgi:hypothetical protein
MSGRIKNFPIYFAYSKKGSSISISLETLYERFFKTLLIPNKQSKDQNFDQHSYIHTLEN